MAETVLPVPLNAQERSLWCWAAVTSALSAVVAGATPMAPCTVASAHFGLACCADADACNLAVALEEALPLAGVGADAREPLAFETVAREIEVRRMPVAARIQDKSSLAGHFVLIVGCDAANRTVVVADPFGTVGYPAPRYRMDFVSLQHDYGGWGRCSGMFVFA